MKFDQKPMAKPKPKQKVIIAMKGHPGTGKSTLARAISAALKCPLLDKDDVRDATLTFQQTLVDLNPFSCSPAIDKIFNQLCYQVLFQMVSTQLSLGLNVVVDSPLSRKSHLDRLVEVAADSDHPDGAKVVVVECKPQNEDEWRRRLEERAAVAAAAEGGGGKWHKPATWRDLERLLEEYGGCYDYDTGGVQKLVLDTTATGVGVDELVSCVLEFVSATACGNVEDVYC